ncbi:MAG: sigma-54-dependent Fis family transcriptional regulator, partial [Polyangiaceae bacterium]
MTESPDEFAAGAPRKVGPTQLLDSGVEIRRLPKLRVSLSLADGETKVVELAQDEILVGSEPGLDIVIDDGSVSRHHLAIRLREDGWLLCDLGSTNGTFIGEMRVERVQLSAKATVRLGRVLVDLQPLSEHVDREISTSDRFGRMLGQSAIMREMFAVLQQVAPSGLTVLVEGETGTGKELAAAAIHENSGREGAFVVLNCGAIPTELIESEIMGHVKGAFTGATENRDGAFVVADGGTLFLDEIGELPLDMQAKLLRVLEQGEVKAVGSDGHRAVDVRVVAATNRRLEAEVEQKRFR